MTFTLMLLLRIAQRISDFYENAQKTHCYENETSVFTSVITF